MSAVPGRQHPRVELGCMRDRAEKRVQFQANNAISEKVP